MHVCFYANMRFALKDQGFINFDSVLCADVFDLGFVVVAEVIEAKAVFAFVNDLRQLLLDFKAFCGVHYTFENRVLDSHAVIDALLCNFRKTFFALRRFCVYVICYQYQPNESPTST